MSFSLIDTRELKSFRLLNKIKKLHAFFEDPTSFGIFVSSDSLHPTERIKLRNEFIKQKLEITQVSNNISSLIFQNQKWEEVNNLLRGHVFLIQDTENNSFNEQKLRFILGQNKFSLRFIFWKHQIYRNKDVLNFLNRPIHEKQAIILPQLLTTYLVKTSQLLPGLTIRTNKSNLE